MMAIGLCAVAAKAQPASSLADGRTGKVAFESLTPATLAQLIRRTGEKTVVFGTLTLPAGAARTPAMVIAHGSGGVRDVDHDWAARLNGLGIAAFVVDSFAPRGIAETATNQARLSPAANMADALSALRLLATHPRIDPVRIGVMGFSRGGDVAVKTALDPVRRGIIDDDLRFAVHVPFYPPCNTMYVSQRPTGAPILFLLGAADDYTPSAPCARYVAWFRAMGVAADSITYADAHHGFDGLRPPRFIQTLQNCRACDVHVDIDRNIWRRLDTGEAMRGDAIAAYYREFGSVGATVGGDHAARAQAQADLATYLKRIFRL